MLEEILKKKENGVLLKVKVKPGSRIFEIDEINPWRNHLEIKVSSKPEKGKANRELLDELKSILDREVRIVSGVKSREKKILVEDISLEEVVQKLDLKNLDK